MVLLLLAIILLTFLAQVRRETEFITELFFSEMYAIFQEDIVKATLAIRMLRVEAAVVLMMYQPILLTLSF